jgi:hypothetical protein
MQEVLRQAVPEPESREDPELRICLITVASIGILDTLDIERNRLQYSGFGASKAISSTGYRLQLRSPTYNNQSCDTEIRDSALNFVDCHLCCSRTELLFNDT